MSIAILIVHYITIISLCQGLGNAYFLKEYISGFVIYFMGVLGKMALTKTGRDDIIYI